MVFKEGFKIDSEKHSSDWLKLPSNWMSIWIPWKWIQLHLEVMHRLTLGNCHVILADLTISVILILQTLCFKMLSLRNYKRMKIKLILLFRLKSQLECIQMKNSGKNSAQNFWNSPLTIFSFKIDQTIGKDTSVTVTYTNDTVPHVSQGFTGQSGTNWVVQWLDGPPIPYQSGITIDLWKRKRSKIRRIQKYWL